MYIVLTEVCADFVIFAHPVVHILYGSPDMTQYDEWGRQGRTVKVLEDQTITVETPHFL